jgi:tetraacyldisaccharide 4'-kinase
MEGMVKTPFWFRRFNIVALALLPLVAVYYFVSKLIFAVRSFCKKRSKTPVICIGGILAGGVGKTPVAREIAKYLNAPVVMRGYGGHKRCGQVMPSDSARDVGDEAKMLSEGLPVFVGDRVENINRINEGRWISCPEAGGTGQGDINSAFAPAIILDDNFQNPSIGKDISVLVFDESVGTGNGLLLPAGPLRETLHSGIRRADAVIIIQVDSGSNSTRVMRLAKRLKKPVFFARREMDATGFFGKYVAFAGIGYPEKFFEALRLVPSMRIVNKVPFADHHFYTKEDAIRLFRKAREFDARLVTTEKDFVKLPRHIRQKVRFVPLKVFLPPNFFLWLDRKLAEARHRSKIAEKIYGGAA